MISIIDYGVGNLESVHKALDKLGFESIITNNVEEINNSKAIILPGVGAFNDAMENLKKSNLIQCIRKNVDEGKALLGICLGMQLLYEKSFEDGEWEGLGLLKGEIVKFDTDVKIPHMGWNELKVNKNDDILKYIKEEDYVYFVHSYYAKSDFSEVIAYANYGVKVPAVVSSKNVYGMQFHPEKSGDTGMNLLKAFGEMIQ